MFGVRAVVWPVGEGRAPALDIAENQQNASGDEAGERLMKVPPVALLVVALLAAGGTEAAPAPANLAMVIALQNRARREAVAYSQVRAEVEAGARPASDLAAARQSLKAAQVAVYDQVADAHDAVDAVFRDLRRQNARRLRTQRALLRRDEAALAAVSDVERRPAEARLQLSRELIEGYRQDDARFANPPAAPPRPRLPILPPRS